MNIIKELTECLALQSDLDAKTMELRARYKAVIEAEEAKGNKGTIFIEIEGEMYALERLNLNMSDAMRTARKLGDFYTYRLYKKGKMI